VIRGETVPSGQAGAALGDLDPSHAGIVPYAGAVAHAGQELGSDAFRLRLVKTGAETGGELLEMEARYGGDGVLPPEHLHPKQVERFEVLEGRVRTIIGGDERIYEAGDTFEVPAGTPHQMAGDGPARMRWQVRPALRTAEFFETLLRGNAGEGFLEEFSEEIRFTSA
jgi:quercetin dioxygenase-like cupin family protein